MNYYLDTEFLEGPQRRRLFGIPLLGLRFDEKDQLELYKLETENTIDLISIGIVAEDGREYYAISKDFNLKEAWNRYDLVYQKGIVSNPEKKVKNYWIRENVLKPIWIELFLRYENEYTFLKGESYDLFEQELKNGLHDDLFTFKSIKALLNRYGKTNKQIAKEIVRFVDYGKYNKIVSKDGDIIRNIMYYHGDVDDYVKQFESENKDYKETPTSFYAYYADYDWVVFCWLFGRMIDLPEGFPMHCNDLKQMLDEKLLSTKIRGLYYPENRVTLKYKLTFIKNHPNYPKEENEHNALADAKWNKKLHEFIKNL